MIKINKDQIDLNQLCSFLPIKAVLSSRKLPDGSGIEIWSPNGDVTDAQLKSAIANYTPPLPPLPSIISSPSEMAALAFVAKNTVSNQVKTDSFPFDHVQKVVALFPAWGPDIDVEVDQVYVYDDELVQCLESHHTQADWTPDVSPSLWKIYRDPNVIAEWVQPTGSTDAYAKGAKVTWIGKTWSSNVDANVWEPPTQWTEVPT